MGKIESAAVDDGLLMAIAALLFKQTAGYDTKGLIEAGSVQAAHIHTAHGVEAAKVASSALMFLSWNVGVPRDMGPASADALRACAVLSALLLQGPVVAQTSAAL